jgi:predicted GIY-YIG superfamily endonuclease
MYYVYILKSIKYTNEPYIGYAGNVVKGLKEHNSGKTFSTKPYML